MKKAFSFILSLVLLASMMCACDRNEDTSVEPVAEAFVPEVLLNSFESYNDLFDIRNSGSFLLELDSSADYVTDGAKCIKYTVGRDNLGKVSTGAFKVPLSDVYGIESHMDFSKMASVTYDVYNASEGEISVFTSIIQRKVAETSSNLQSVTIAPGERKTVTYSVNRYELYYAMDLDKITHVNVLIVGLDPVVYVDNMRLHYVDESFVTPTIEVDENELLSFEKGFQRFVTYINGTMWKSEIVTDPENASEGLRYVKVSRDGIEDGVVANVGGRFGISAKYLSSIDLDSYGDDTYICFDIKCSWQGETPFWFIPRLLGTVGNLARNVQGINVPADGQWHTVCIPRNWAPAFFDGIELSFDGSSAGNLYFDNFRIETSIPENAITGR